MRKRGALSTTLMREMTLLMLEIEMVREEKETVVRRYNGGRHRAMQLRAPTS
jgi:hypothetical protein